jgi:hypothetical protein
VLYTNISPNRTSGHGTSQGGNPLFRGRTAQGHKTATAPLSGREFTTNLIQTSRGSWPTAGFWTRDGLISYQIWTLAWTWLLLLRCHFLPRKRAGQHLLPTFVHIFSPLLTPPPHSYSTTIAILNCYYNARFVLCITKLQPNNKIYQSPRSG